jgi:hypothetical protein
LPQIYGLSQMSALGRIWLICLECAAIFGHLPLTVRCALGSIQKR